MAPTNAQPVRSDHRIEKLRHEIKPRLLQVSRTKLLTPHMLRVTLAGEELDGFVSASFDDHVKVIFPMPGEDRPVLALLAGAEAGARPPMRNYTPRRYDGERRELDIDFVLHGEGAAAMWAASARPGQYLGIAGPRGSFVVPLDFDWYFLIGDETALPAIGRRLEELPEGSRALVLVETAEADSRIAFASAAQLELHWVVRRMGEAGDLLAALRTLDLPPGDGHAWVATEASQVAAIRSHLIAERGMDKRYVRASSYWKRGASGHHETIDQ
jgi:NADPH-dependent ferric siderophore reductase